LGLSVTYAGSLQFTYPGRATERMAATCALDVAEGGAKTLDEVAALLNMTGENARRIEARALGKLRALISHLNPHEK
jgi:DNA-directed RNA polymerase sigma subunit (sigma70/sigma32)